MPRKKMTHSKMDKSSGIVSKASKKKSDLSTQTQALEKDFKEMSLQLANQLRNDLVLLKEKEKTLLTTINKLNSQHKAANKNYSTLSKSKNKTSSATKKQLKELKKNAAQLVKTIKNLEVELTKVRKHKKILSIKQINFATLSKQIAKFDKVAKAKSVKKTKLVKKPQKKTIKTSNNVSKKPILQQQTIQPLTENADKAAYILEAPVNLQMETEEVK